MEVPSLGKLSNENVRAASSLSAWLFLNCALNFFNKWLFAHTDFKFPVFFTMFHMVAQFIGSGSLIYFFKAAKIERKHWTEYRGRILLLAMFFVTNIVTNNWSLLHISLSVNQIVKSTLPLPTMVLSLMFESKSYTVDHWTAVFLIIAGSWAAVWGNPHYTAFGFGLVVTSTFCVAAWTILSALLLGPGDITGLNSINLSFYGSVPAMFVLLILWSQLEEYNKVIAYMSETPGQGCIYIAIGSCLAFVYNIFHFLLIKYTSTLTSTIAGNMKIILVILISIVFLEKGISTTNAFGMCIFIIGCGAYSYVSKLKPAEPNKAEYDPIKDPEEGSPGAAAKASS